MAIMVIESAPAMRAHAETWLVKSAVATVRGEHAGAAILRASHDWCMQVAEAIDAGIVQPGDYRWNGTWGAFEDALLTGALVPVTGNAQSVAAGAR